MFFPIDSLFWCLGISLFHALIISRSLTGHNAFMPPNSVRSPISGRLGDGCTTSSCWAPHARRQSMLRRAITECSIKRPSMSIRGIPNYQFDIPYSSYVYHRAKQRYSEKRIWLGLFWSYWRHEWCLKVKVLMILWSFSFQNVVTRSIWRITPLSTYATSFIRWPQNVWLIASISGRSCPKCFCPRKNDNGQYMFLNASIKLNTIRTLRFMH